MHWCRRSAWTSGKCLSRSAQTTRVGQAILAYIAGSCPNEPWNPAHILLINRRTSGFENAVQKSLRSAAFSVTPGGKKVELGSSENNAGQIP